jgi:large subunit ribosomal protein L21
MEDVSYMYAIIELGGMQWKVREKQTLRVPLIELEPGKPVQIDKVLLFADEQNIQIGRPNLPGAMVEATVVSHGKGDKILIFKKKRKKTYQKRQGHRQRYTEIRIDKITA